MPYTFTLKIEKEKSALSLTKGDVVVAIKEWSEERDMGQQLFEAIAELLAKNSLRPEQIYDFVIASAMPENYTSMRIAETVKRVYTFGIAFSGNTYQG